MEPPPAPCGWSTRSPGPTSGVGTTGFVRGASPSTGRELWRITDGGASMLLLPEIDLGAISGVRPGTFEARCV